MYARCHCVGKICIVYTDTYRPVVVGVSGVYLLLSFHGGYSICIRHYDAHEEIQKKIDIF